MDETNSGFGNLSLQAAEWKPSSKSKDPSNNVSTSDTNSGLVKEFIPGRGWATSESVGNEATTSESHDGGYMMSWL